MKWIVDAQLPKHLAHWLRYIGEDAVHTLELPNGNRTADNQIRSIATSEQRIVISKDHDFYHSHLLTSEPPQLLLITTGNITNNELIKLLQTAFPHICLLFGQYSVIELSRSSIIARA